MHMFLFSNILFSAFLFFPTPFGAAVLDTAPGDPEAEGVVALYWVHLYKLFFHQANQQ